MSSIFVRRALETALNSADPALETAWENTHHTPSSATTPFQSVTLMFAEPDNTSYGSGYQEQGIMQIDLNYPKDAGPIAAYTRAEYLRVLFRRGISFAFSGSTFLYHDVGGWYEYFTQTPVASLGSADSSVTIQRTPEIMAGRNEGGRYVLPVRVRFFANNY